MALVLALFGCQACVRAGVEPQGVLRATEALRSNVIALDAPLDGSLSATLSALTAQRCRPLWRQYLPSGAMLIARCLTPGANRDLSTVTEITLTFTPKARGTRVAAAAETADISYAGAWSWRRAFGVVPFPELGRRATITAKAPANQSFYQALFRDAADNLAVARAAERTGTEKIATASATATRSPLNRDQTAPPAIPPFDLPDPAQFSYGRAGSAR